MRNAVTTVLTMVMVLVTAPGWAAPIHSAAAKGDLTQVRLLLNKDASMLDLVDKDGATPLHHAVAGRHKAVVEFLLGKGANVNAKKTDGVTPLHVAVALKSVEIARALVLQHANPGAEDGKGRTPLSMATEAGDPKMIALLSESVGAAESFAVTVEGWPTKGHDFSRTNATTDAGPKGPDVKKKWEFDTNLTEEVHLVVGGGTVYALATGKRLFAVNAASGKQLWKADIQGGPHRLMYPAAPTVSGGVVYVGGNTGTLYSFDTATGKPGTTWNIDKEGRCSVAILGRTLYAVASISGHVCAIDLNSAKKKWTRETARAVYGDLALAEGMICVGASPFGRGGGFYAIDAGGGNLRWVFPGTCSEMDLTPTLVGRVVYGAAGGTVCCLDAATGVQRWRFEVPNVEKNGPIWPALAAAGHFVYAKSTSTLYALDADSGAQKWSFKGEGDAAPIVAAGLVYVYAGNRLCALDATTGKKKWDLPMDRIRSLAVVNGVLYAGSDGKIVALSD